MATYAEVEAKMKKFASRQSTEKLCGSLEILAVKDELDQGERMARAVLIGVLCERHPEVDRAFDVWAESEDTDGTDPVPTLVAAARAVVAA